MASAIDFRRLLLEERRRARREARGAAASPPPASASASAPAPAAPPPVPPVPGEEVPPPSHLPPDVPAALRPEAHSLPPERVGEVHYVPEYLPPSFARGLERWLLSLPEAGGGEGRAGGQGPGPGPAGRWTRLRHAGRRVALFDGRRIPLPPPLAEISASLAQGGYFPASHPPNHVLVNSYGPGGGILPHTDGPAYLDRTATASLGGDAVLRFRRRLGTDEIGLRSPGEEEDGGGTGGGGMDVLLSGGGSLVVFAGDAYSRHVHSIAEAGAGASGGEPLAETTSGRCGNCPPGVVVRRDRPRISLTFRHKLEGAD